MAAAFAASASRPSQRIHLQAFCGRTCFNDHKDPWAAEECNARRTRCLSYPKRNKRAAKGGSTACMSQSRSNVYFLKSLGKYLHFGMPTVPYWLPAVTQEDGKMEDREGEGVRGEIKGVAMMWGHEPRGSLSFLFLICLSDDNKKKHSSSKEEGSTSQRKGENDIEGKRSEKASVMWKGNMTNHFSCWWQSC